MRGAATNDVPVDEIAIGDAILVRPGEMVPCDGTIMSGQSHLDTATLTGEPIPVRANPGLRVLSGTLNLEGPLTIRATSVAA